MTIKAILFDLDDTLYPQIQYVQGAYRDITKWIGMLYDVDQETLCHSLLQQWREKGSRYPYIFSETLCRLGIADNNLVEQMVNLYHEHRPQLMPFPDVVETLNSLKRKFKLGLVTDGHAAMQRRKISVLAIAGYFDTLVFTGDWGKPFYKPHPRGYQEALMKLSVSSHRVVFVGDSPDIDLCGAKNVGLHTVWISREANPDLKTQFSDFVINDLRELASLFDESNE